VRWQDQRESENVEDRRGLGPARIGGGLGIGGIVLVLAVSYFTGMNPLTLLELMSGLQSTTEPQIESVPTGPVKDEIGRFASVVLADTEDTWHQLLPKAGRQYENPRLVLFTGAVHSACGATSSAVGPFYCPQDRKLYLDLSFFKEMSQRLGAPEILPRPMSSPTKWATMFRIFLGLRRKFSACSVKRAKQKATPSRFAWNCRPIVLPESGVTMPAASGA